MTSLLTPGQRRELRARAHALHPVAMISDAGLSAGVLAEIERGLKIHELIKIRVFSADRDQREQLASDICAQTGAQPVQHIGKILVIYREKPQEEPPRRAAPRRTAPRRDTRNSRDSRDARSGRDAGKRPRAPDFAARRPRSASSAPARRGSAVARPSQRRAPRTR